MHEFRNSVAFKITHIVVAPRCFSCGEAMVFTMQNPYLLAGEKQCGEKHIGTHDDNSGGSKKMKKAPSAASLVP